MRAAVRLGLVLLRREAAGGRAVLLLPVAAFAVVTALALTVFGGAGFFFGIGGEEGMVYELLAIVAVTLLVVPLWTLCGAAARLSARRRDRRLATLSLLGASGGTVTMLSLIESVVLAATGTAVGVLGHVLLSPLVGLVPFHGGPIGAGNVLLGPTGTALCAAALVVLAALSSLAGLRRVHVSPLGVRMRQQAAGASVLRLLGFVVALGAGVVVGQLVRPDQGTGVVIAGVGMAFGLTMAALNLVGPLVLRAQAWLGLRRYGGRRELSRLLAARTVLDSPRAAWRQVGGVAMTAFAAVFAGVGMGEAAGTAGTPDPVALMLAEDLRTGVILTLVISFVTVAASVAVNQAADLLDRRDLYAALDRIGVPVGHVDEARVRAVMRPLVAVALWSAGSAAVLVLPIAALSRLLDPVAIAVVLASMLGGLALVRLTMTATRPLLARVMAGPVPTP